MNNHIPKFTYIIPFRYSPDKILNLKRIVEWVSGYQGVEVIIVEQDRHSKISHLTIRATHIFMKSNGSFNKSLAYNFALKRVSSPVVVFGDCNTIMNPLELIECLKSLDGFDCVIPSRDVTMLSQIESTGDFNNILSIKRSIPKLNMTDGISIFKRSSIIGIGGWCEDIVGDSFENKFQDFKISKMLKVNNKEYSQFQLFHQINNTDNGAEDRYNKIINPLKSINIEQMRQYLSSTIPKIGIKNKYF